jgi:ribonuclease HI
MYYAIKHGRKTGIYTNIDDVLPLVRGYVGSSMKSFLTRDEAETFCGYNQPPTHTRSAKNIEIYCDGACQNNGKTFATGGSGVYIANYTNLNLSQPLPKIYGIPTNQKTELYAMIMALNLVQDKFPHDSAVIIKSDSQYTVNCINQWLPQWKRNGFMDRKKRPVKNQSLLLELDRLYPSLSTSVKIIWCQGHTGLRDGNYYADLLAKSAIKNKK